MALFQSANGGNQPNSTPDNNRGGVRVKSVLRYTMMPEILPRIRALGFHFGHFAYLLALVFASARLIPQNHPVMNATNMGRFGIRQVIAIAANNVTWSTKNIDQIAIFSAIVIGLIMIVIQAGLIAFAALVGFNPAEANTGSFFSTESPESDLVLQTLNMVFGKADGGDFFFAPEGDVYGISGNYQPIYNAVYDILSLYSKATMVIAVIIVLYYVLTVVGETAQTGTPFGGRFNSLWAPIRLVVALGLLVPLGSGLNSAQYITFWVAKMGSGLGNQAWYIFFDNVVTQDPSAYVVGRERDYSLRPLVQNAFIAEFCTQGYNKYNGQPTYQRSAPVSVGNGFEINWNKVDGVQTNIEYESCGKLVVDPTLSTTITSKRGQGSRPTVTRIVEKEDNELVPVAEIYDLVEDIVVNDVIPKVEGLATTHVGYSISVGGRDDTSDPLNSIRAELDTLTNEVTKKYTDGIEAIYTTSALANLQDKMAQDKDKGWAYAGIWYMQIGRIIQQLEAPKTSAIPSLTLPETKYESVNGQRTRRTLGAMIWGGNGTAGGDEVEDNIYKIKTILNRKIQDGDARRAARHGADDNDTVEDTAYEACVGVDEDATFGDKIKCTIVQVFVPDQLFVMSSGSTLDPMAALVSAGSEIFNKAFWMVLGGVAGEVVGGALSGIPGLSGIIGGILDGLSGVVIVIGLLGLPVGFILFFLVPLMPFMYFFFAIITWILEIIEAVIGMPLWALSFLQISGDGMPGQAAMSGFYILLSILIRPALIIISLIMGYLLFIFGTYLLSMLFEPLLNVVNGDNTKGIQIMVFTIIFATLVYNIGTVSFKMVDTIPQSVMRWIGNNVGVFQDGKDPIGESRTMMTAVSGVASGFASQQLSGGAKGIGKAIGGKLKPKEDEIQKVKIVDDDPK